MAINISTTKIKELRMKTGAGMMACKKALQEEDGNFERAVSNLRKKGLLIANKKSCRSTTEGLIESYIHNGSKIGVIIEINCETDFVARRPEFQELAKNIAMQIAACPTVRYVDIESIPATLINEETEIENNREDIINKPLDIKTQIVNGRIQKRLKELSLVDQNFIRDPSMNIQDLITNNIALMGENIKIRRFVRFMLGEK
jgi:elongation factor Ts|uniref:Elongation factor Ts, mitochondrial n=1 Tax=Thorea hispida TaxID=202687 RepID=A0A1C9CAD9_9FLOR|nr:elongation factor Ts [Thorea hispida]AOM65334.1 elongation factor Ts [Thorea hispida]ARX95894.1 translation elongation factor Ts [Thorea hispida]UNJ79179.1 elongation factor Ts [Thorea hispida]